MAGGNIARKVILGIDVSQFRKGITQVDAQMKGMSRQMNNLGGLIGATFMAGIIGNFVMESIKLNSELQKAEAGFKRVGASSSDLGNLRAATRGLVTDVMLMQKTTQAANFGIPVEKLATLFEFAQRRAAETGESVDYLVNSIVVGLGRKSVKIIDNLGISATALKEEMGGVAVATADVAEVTEAVGRIAERSLGEMSAATVTAADEAARLRIEWTNLMASFDWLAGAALTGLYGIQLDWEIFMGGLEGGWKGMLENMAKELVRQSGALAPGDPGFVDTAKLGPLGGRGQDSGPMPKPIEKPVFLETLSLLREQLKMLKEEWESVEIGTQSFTDLAESIRVAEEKLEEVTQPVQVFAEETNVAAKSWHNLGVEVQRTAGVIKESLKGELVEDFTRKFEAAAMVGQEFGDILTQSFKTSVETGEKFFDVLGRALKAYVAELLAAVAATIALSAIMSALPMGTAFGATFNTMSQGTQVGSWMDIIGLLRGKDLVMSTTRSGNALNRSGGAF